jgi:hypothetical protein
VEAVASLIKGVAESVLYDTLKREEERNPGSSLEEQLRAAGARLVPANIPGSPAYHREALQDLLAIVAEHKLPSFFLTLTADEITADRWPEVEAMELKARQLTGIDTLTWRDLPVEMARLFHDRVQAFMADHVLNPNRPILGKIRHHTVRYESQVDHGCACMQR